MFKGEQLCPSENKNEGRRRPKINNINSSKKVTESMIPKEYIVEKNICGQP